jgi:hypothetical protein
MAERLAFFAEKKDLTRWVVRSGLVPGVITEANTLDEAVKKIRSCLPSLLEMTQGTTQDCIAETSFSLTIVEPLRLDPSWRPVGLA